MARLLKKQKHEIGLGPDDLKFRGEKKSDSVLLRVIDFDAENKEEKVIGSIEDDTYIHFKELLDNINHAIESSESYREILTDQLNIYHTTISSKLNDIMKFLTVFSVVFIPLTFIAGIYGTNFDILPELHYKYSYFIMLGLMLIIALGMLKYFRNKKWL